MRQSAGFQAEPIARNIRHQVQAFGLILKFEIQNFAIRLKRSFAADTTSNIRLWDVELGLIMSHSCLHQRAFLC